MSEYIASLKAREILDSRGNPTLEVEVTTSQGKKGVAKVPSGASTGIYEAVELRDGGLRYHGKGVIAAIKKVEGEITNALAGINVFEQNKIDKIMIELDGTPNKSRLGGNTILGVSLACAKAAALSRSLQLYELIEPKACILPVPFLNVINGGKHAGNRLDIQEFMIAPTGAQSFNDSYRIGSEVYHELKSHLRKKYGSTATNVGDEGGFAPPISSPEEALDVVWGAVEEMGYQEKVVLALDVAASSFFMHDLYEVEGKMLDRNDLISLYEELVSKYPIKSIEDPLQEEDYEGFALLTKTLDIQVVGDDLFVTNPKRLRKGIEMGACNALLWKVNQVGTLTEALEAAKLARKNGYAIMASHRSGETEDTWVAELAVGIQCGQIKSGAPCRGERTAKYNQLLRIEEYLGNRARYPSNLFN